MPDPQGMQRRLSALGYALAQVTIAGERVPSRAQMATICVVALQAEERARQEEALLKPMASGLGQKDVEQLQQEKSPARTVLEGQVVHCKRTGSQNWEELVQTVGSEQARTRERMARESRALKWVVIQFKFVMLILQYQSCQCHCAVLYAILPFIPYYLLSHSPRNMLSTQEEVFFPTDYYLALAKDRFSSVVVIELLRRIINEGRAYIDKEIALLTECRMDKVTPKIANMEPFLKSQLMEHNYAERAYRDLPCETGLRITIEGGIENCSVIFHVIDGFLRRHQLSIYQMTPLQHYMFSKYCVGFPAMVFEWYKAYSMIKYAKGSPKKLIDAMTQAEYVIGRNQIPCLPNGNSYDTILAFRDCFRKYIQEKEVRVSRLQITQQSIYYLSNSDNNIQFRDKLQQFLLTFSLAYYPVTIFNDEFEAAIFMAYCARQLKDIKLLEDASRGGKVGRIASVNYLCDQDTADHNIEELYYRMIKSYKLIPTLTRPTAGLRMRPLQWPGMLSLSSLRQKVHIINDKFKIVVRSFGSIHQNEDTVMFLVHELEQCQEFRAVLAENSISEGSFKDWIRGERGERYLQYLTEKSRFFNNSIAWYINMQTKNKDRIARDLEYFFNIRYREVMDIKIVIPVNSKELVEFVFPIFMQKLLELTRFSDSGLIKTVEFITSCSEEERIREYLREGIYALVRSRCLKIQTFNPLELSLFSVEKMVELRYLTVEFWPKGQPRQLNTLSSLAGTVFVHEATKVTGIRKIILPLRQNSCSLEYILNIHFEKVFSAGPEGVREEAWREMGPGMAQVVGLVRKFCPNMDMLVLYGQAGMQSVETNLFYCQINDGDTQATITKMEIDFTSQKISLNQKVAFDLKFKVNHDKQRYVVETHEECADEVRRLLKSTITPK